MKLFIPIVFIALLFSCGNSKEIAEPSSAQNQEEAEVKPNKTNPEITKKEDNTSYKIKTEKPIEIKAHFGEFVESDIIQINSAEISGNNLLLSGYLFWRM